MSERIVEVDGRRFFVRTMGNGAPVVLLHGFPQTGEAWREVADRLAGRNRVVVPDLPGFGRSDPAPSAAIPDVAALLVRVLEAEGIDKFALVGHDFGGSIAFRMALAYPERVERLVVVNAPFRHLNVLRAPHFLAFNVPIVPDLVLAAFGKQLVPAMIRLTAGRRGALDAAALREYASSVSDLKHARNTLAYYRASTRKLLVDRAKALIPGGSEDRPVDRRRIETPTMLVWGMKDPVLPPSLIPTIERDLERVEAVVKLDDVGHFVPDEAPDELFHAIEDFLFRAL